MFKKLESQPVESEREKESRFGLYIYKGIEEALEKIKQRFEQAKNPDDNLDFHNRDHTNKIVQRVEYILSTIQHADSSLLTSHDVKIGCLAGAFHDVIQNYDKDKQDGKFEKIIRKRHTSDNEKDSAKEAIKFMKQANQEEGKEVFTEQDMKTVQEAIEATIPGDILKNNTVIQPNLTKDSSLITRAVALADLGAAGLDGAEAFLADGDNFFREENMDIADAVKNIKNLTNEQKEYYKKRMITWAEFQPKFAQGRKDSLDKELKGIPGTAKDAVRALFNKFDESIQAAQERAEKRKTMSLEELAEDMGYKI
ncbi:hypothetical protein MYX06_01425 [Patescibacteria group bacterium AH-259-L05]|nr:hypothetical protein [Patescibacteria group bacterium AH-259-L05]